MMYPSQFEAIYSRYQSSGLTVKSFCENEGLLPSRFYYWQKRMKHFLPPKGGFVPIVITDTASMPSVQGKDLPDRVDKTEHTHPVSQARTLTCELRFPNGVSLRLKGDVDYELIKSLLILK